MGLLIDTDVWVLAEKSQAPLSLERWAAYGGAFMSSVTVSELLVGVLTVVTDPWRSAAKLAPSLRQLPHGGQPVNRLVEPSQPLA